MPGSMRIPRESCTAEKAMSIFTRRMIWGPRQKTQSRIRARRDLKERSASPATTSQEGRPGCSASGSPR